MTEAGFSSIEEAIEAIAQGALVIVVDDEDRENEGDFIAAAEKVTPEIVNFMVKRGGGLFCVTILPDLARRLQLAPAAARNTALQETAFLESVDSRSCRTGISAFERAETVRTILNPRTIPEDLARPGHVFPIVAKDGGVLRRAGHTEASVDLARLAGLAPAGVLCEILDDDGSMARRDRLFELAREHRMPIVTIQDLIRHRRRNERLVERAAEARFPTAYGEFKIVGYEVSYENHEPFALVMGDLQAVEAPLVRMHSSCFTGDVLESLRCECGDQLDLALRRIALEGTGALVYLPQEGRGIGLINKIRAYALQDKGMDTVDANLALGYKADMRDYGIGIQILKDLGLSKVRLLTNNPKKVDAFIYYGYDLEVVDQVPIIAPHDPHRESYLRTKRERMGHQIPEGSGAAAPGASPAGAEHEARGAGPHSRKKEAS
jgi:3,4-dihydroxy 2-butanone 4-phosphate synthase/GTP cyclohydrolase II